jgi:hypothetical protein
VSDALRYPKCRTVESPLDEATPVWHYSDSYPMRAYLRPRAHSIPQPYAASTSAWPPRM